MLSIGCSFRQVYLLPKHNPRKNALLKAGNKSDTIDARKLAELLRAGLLSPVYHGQNSTAAVKHLGRSYAASPKTAPASWAG
jgi:hypothetical protein